MLRILILSILTGVSLVLCGQIRSDSLFTPDDLQYFSTLERKAFSEYFNGNPDYLALLAAVDPAATERELTLYRDWLSNITAEIRNKRFDKLNDRKKIERVRNTVTTALLENSKIDAGFGDLFKFGQFNQVTSSAVYALVLEELGIPYAIRETPTKVYLAAYPEGINITVNTSESFEQYFSFDHGTRDDFVEYIHETGIIDYLTYRNNTKNNLFQSYFFSAEPLGLSDIAGMLYLNAAVKDLTLMRNIVAYAQFEKAYLLFPSYKSQYLLYAQLSAFLNQKEYTDHIYLGYLIKARKLIGHGISTKLMEGFLLDIIANVLVEEEDQAGFLEIHDYLIEFLDHDSLEHLFNFHYHYEIGRQYYNEGRYERALDHLEAASRLDPGHNRSRDLFTRTLALYSTMVSPSIILEKLEDYDTTFADLQENQLYIMVKTQTYLLLFGEAFQLKDARQGARYMDAFEGIVANNPELGVEHALVGRSYSSAAIYYYGRGELEKAKEVLNRGLTIAPENVQLLLKLQAIE